MVVVVVVELLHIHVVDLLHDVGTLRVCMVRIIFYQHGSLSFALILTTCVCI